MNVLSAMMTLCLVFQSSPLNAGKPTQQEIEQVILEDSDCVDPDAKFAAPHRLSISHLEYFDLIGNGKQQAVVVGSTCMTGTAGPDVHAVFERNAEGKVVSLPFKRVEEEKPLNRLPLFGNRNYTLMVANGRPIAKWKDSSDREEPLTIHYKWDGSSFVLESMEKEGPFKTSYDCAKAEEELEKAICYSVALSALDVQLASAYRERLQSLAAKQKKGLQDQQRKWLAERGKTCVIYKWWVECLTDLYTKRIAELQTK
jgi:uncharacterized protein YecT (DUF1311 family)